MKRVGRKVREREACDSLRKRHPLWGSGIFPAGGGEAGGPVRDGWSKEVRVRRESVADEEPVAALEVVRGAQFLLANYHGPTLPDIGSAIATIVGLVLLLKVWKPSRTFRGKIIDKDDLTWKRPAGGISPRHYYEVLGMAARADIEEDTVLQWAHLE